MKIAHIVRQFHPSIGGLEDFVFNLATEQLASGHSVSVFTLNSDFQNDEKLSPRELYKGIEIRRYPWFFSKRYPICFMAMATLNGYDIVHIHAIDYFVDYLSLCKRIGILKPTTILSTHGGFFHTKRNALLKQYYFKTITKFSTAAMDAVICCSENDHRLFRKLNGNTHLINNGVKLKKFGEPLPVPGKTQDMIYFGRFSQNKCIPWLIDAYAGIRNPAGKLKIIGRSKTGNVQVLKKMIQQLDCADRVELILDVSDEVILHHISSAKYTISASEYEGFGLSIVELMSYGLVPFLSSKPPSFREFVGESRCGMLFDYEREKFEEQYQQLVRNWSPDLAHRAREYSDRFSWQSVAKSIESIYQASMDPTTGIQADSIDTNP